jgi:hypothetical protein
MAVVRRAAWADDNGAENARTTCLALYMRASLMKLNAFDWSTNTLVWQSESISLERVAGDRVRAPL